MDYNHLVMTPAQCAKFDKHIVSTRIRAGRSVDTLALPPATDRKQRRTVEYLLTTALAGMEGPYGSAITFALLTLEVDVAMNLIAINLICHLILFLPSQVNSLERTSLWAP